MSRFTGPLNLCRRLLPCGLALCWLVICDSTASAACGDYLMVNGHAAAAAHNGDSDHVSSTQPASSRQSACDGPQCHRNVPSPAPAPVIPVIEFEREARLPVGDSDVARPDAVRLSPEPPARARAGFTPAVERPPRLR